MRTLACRSYVVVLVLLSCLLLLNGCKSYKEQEDEFPDTRTSGSINVSADESFKPVIDEQVQVFQDWYPDAKINVHYKPEAEILRDFSVDSVRMIVSTRAFTRQEENYLIDSLKIGPVTKIMARDAIAVVVHPDSPDSLFTMQEIRDILTGRVKKNLIPVFDGVQATSTVRFIVDSVLRNDSLTPKTLAARSSEGVIDYVATHPEAVGFIGVSWIGNREDTLQVSFLKKVKIAYLESNNMPGKYILPVQANIYLDRYPMVRDLVVILKERHKGLGDGFADFMSGEIGQLIFKRAYLMPAQRSFRIRPIQLRE